MATSTPSNTSSNKCRCDQKCGCCLKKKKKEPGFIGKRPWLLVIVAFGMMFSAWSVMIYMAVTHQPEVIPLVTHAAE